MTASSWFSTDNAPSITLMRFLRASRAKFIASLRLMPSVLTWAVPVTTTWICFTLAARSFDLTRTRSATAGEGERGLQWMCFHKLKRNSTAAGGWLHRLVRPHWLELKDRTLFWELS